MIANEPNFNQIPNDVEVDNLRSLYNLQHWAKYEHIAGFKSPGDMTNVKKK